MFQCTYEYGRESCSAAGRLAGDEVCQQLRARLQQAWCQLRAASQEHITRLRVAAVFHRTADEVSRGHVFTEGFRPSHGTGVKRPEHLWQFGQ